jgi:predicted acetylornithine/succinylornithine family transaminase
VITQRLLDESKTYLMDTYKRLPIILTKGRGTKVYDSHGKEYIDFVSGIAVNNLGHCHPKIVVALQKQAQRLIHVSNLYHIEPQIKLAKILVEHSFADKVFFSNSGAEANEAAIKLLRKYSRENFVGERHEIITTIGSFHGRTLATLTATGQEKFQKGFEPLVPGFRYVPFDDLDAVRNAITDKTCAVMVEPIQGESGVRIPKEGYLKGLREICDEKNLLFILDEVQTGMGRTGKLFAYEHFGIEPDIMTLAKALGGGIAIGATLAKDKVSKAFVPGSHASTFGGNPLACAAAYASVEAILEDGFILENSRRMGDYLKMGLERLKKEYSFINEVRGMGLLIGMELITECTNVVTACLERGFLINCTEGNVLRFMPPLIITEKEIDALLDALEDVFHQMMER